MVRKLISMLLAFMMLSGFCMAAAEEPSTPVAAPLVYQGGVVLRTIPRGADNSDLIQLAYSLTNMPYIVMDKTYEWEIYVQGGTAPYEVSALLAWKASADEAAWSVAAYYEPSDFRVQHTFIDEGLYFWQFEVIDSTGQSLVFQSRQYESYTEADETDVSTTVGKVNSIVNSLITDDMSDYARAKVLHDWLIYNANYDTTYTYYDASGVFLHGKGVCESYARAYLMLCTAAGLECMYVSGTAGNDPDPANWGSHGWNLVWLNGSWYHVDCTWDDPVSGDSAGGYENHSYFCVDDATLAKDHRWNRPDDVFISGMIVPDAEGGEYEQSAAGADYDFTFTTWDEYDARFDEMVARGERYPCVRGYYVGNEDLYDMYDGMGTWARAKIQELVNKGLIGGSYNYGFGGNIFSFWIPWFEPVSYIRIEETNVIINTGKTETIQVTDLYPADNSVVWSSSDPTIATASSTYDSENATLVVTVSGVKSGSAVITATTSDGYTDGFNVIVLGAYAPEMYVQFEETDDGVTVSWSGVPGVTEYDVVKRAGSDDVILATTSNTFAALTSEQLSPNVQNEVYVIARRVVAGTTQASYQSDIFTYGSAPQIGYTSIMPAGTLSIEAEAFLNDTNLTTLYIPDGVLSIGQAAFSGCSAMTAVRIPASVTEIGENAFQGCPLEYITVTKGSPADIWLKTNAADVTVIYE